MTIIPLNIPNPDSESIAKKSQINISLSTFDISASGYYGLINTNYARTEQIVTIPEENLITTSSYYTPLYTEKLNYNVWLNTINKNFEELT